MPTERREVDRASLVRALERALSVVTVVEEGAWDVDQEVACELVEACLTLERALGHMRGEQE